MQRDACTALQGCVHHAHLHAVAVKQPAQALSKAGRLAAAAAAAGARSRICAPHRLYPGLLQIAAIAHIASGFCERRPSTIRAGLGVLRSLPASCEVLLLRGVGSLLLGEPGAAAGFIKAAAK